MFFFDLETIGTTDNPVALSIGIVHVEDDSPRTFADLISDKHALFLKLDIKSQLNAGRKINKETLEWWKKQPIEIQKENLLPSANDLDPLEAINVLKKWIYNKSKKVKSNTCFTRGGFDQLVIEGLCVDTLGVKPPFDFWDYRDVRTAIELLYPETSERAYVKIDETRCPGANEYFAKKHNPVIDSALDAAMILYGI